MPLIATEHDPLSRKRVIPVYLQHGTIGLVLVTFFTIRRLDDTREIVTALGPSGPILIALFFLFSSVLALLKFPLTKQIFVSLVITAYISMVPLLGLVLSSWIAVSAAITTRLIGMMRIGPSKVDMRDPPLEWARTFALFGTYGIPVILATLAYEAIGGTIPLLEPTLAAAGRIALSGIVLILSNNLVVSRVEQAYGYSPAMSLKLAIIDSSIYFVTLPYSILTTLTYGPIGWGGVLAAAFTGIVANAVGRRLADMRGDREQLIQRLASLTNIGKTITLNCTTDELLMAIYTECRKVIDVSIFSIALLDNATRELSFELNVKEGTLLPKGRLPIGEGLNSWVVQEGEPLMLGSAREEERLGLTSFDDGMQTESWLGVPMAARDHLIGVISIQSFEKNAFSQDDVVLLTAIANQAAVAIENSYLYRDLEGMNAALEQRVSERTNELREANVRLIAADRSKNQFLASMSHELRTPLNAIIGFSAILLESTRSTLPPRFYRFMENIRTAGGHLLELINDILDLAKIESGKLELHADTFDVRDTIATVERVMKGIAAETNTTIVTRIDPAITDVHLDEGRLKQILLNLLSNAVKFSREGAFVQLTVTNVPAEDSSLGCHTVRFQVADEGIGIAPEDLSNIFDEFYQVNRGHRPKGGTGLGLSLTRSFVELHQGTISVESQPGSGSVFTVDLPHDYRQAARIHLQPETPVDIASRRSHPRITA
ncbi:MAG TPA: ATP-binding protein [Thermoanaerobaculia bacterium]|nr:ATP-binding protein [Thermoanaerobaculia bacterium]